jgi:hypothetical protein
MDGASRRTVAVAVHCLARSNELPSAPVPAMINYLKETMK